MKRFISVPNWMIEEGDKFLIQMYVATQCLCKKNPVGKRYVCGTTMTKEMEFPAERVKRNFPKIKKMFETVDNGVLVSPEDFHLKKEDIFQMLNDEEFRLLIGDAALLLHYLTLLKFAGYYKKAICGLNKLAESEGVSARTIGDLNKKLVDLGLVEINHRMDKCNEYIIKYNEESELFS
jgi:hypothetical protein